VKPSSCPSGFNVLRNDPRAASRFAPRAERLVRVNVHTGAMITDQESSKATLMKPCVTAKGFVPKRLIFADVQVKHAVPLGDCPIEIAARDTLDRGLADALIISASAQASRRNCPMSSACGLPVPKRRFCWAAADGGKCGRLLGPVARFIVALRSNAPQSDHQWIQNALARLRRACR